MAGLKRKIEDDYNLIKKINYDSKDNPYLKFIELLTVGVFIMLAPLFFSNIELQITKNTIFYFLITLIIFLFLKSLLSFGVKKDLINNILTLGSREFFNNKYIKVYTKKDILLSMLFSGLFTYFLSIILCIFLSGSMKFATYIISIIIFKTCVCEIYGGLKLITVGKKKKDILVIEKNRTLFLYELKSKDLAEKKDIEKDLKKNEEKDEIKDERKEKWKEKGKNEIKEKKKDEIKNEEATIEKAYKEIIS